MAAAGLTPCAIAWESIAPDARSLKQIIAALGGTDGGPRIENDEREIVKLAAMAILPEEEGFELTVMHVVSRRGAYSYLLAGHWKPPGSTGADGAGATADASAGGTPVAVKLYRPSALSKPEMRQRWQREVDVLGTLQSLENWEGDSPRLLAVGRTHDQFPFLVETLCGESCLNAFTPGDTVAAAILGVVEDVSTCLHRAHALGIAHLDIKFDNILRRPAAVEGDERARWTVVDWNSAGHVNDRPGDTWHRAPPRLGADLAALGRIVVRAASGQLTGTITAPQYQTLVATLPPPFATLGAHLLAAETFVEGEETRDQSDEARAERIDGMNARLGEIEATLRDMLDRAWRELPR